MIDLMFPHFSYESNKSSGVNNPGGGMATKFIAVRDVLSQRYKVNCITEFSQVKSDILLIEPLTIRLMNKNFKEWIAELKACTARKILYCSEMEVSRWAPNTFQEIVKFVDCVTANTNYQTALINTLSAGRVHPARLCDPIDESLFRPMRKKRRVFSAGRISLVKNTEFLIDVFREGKEVWGPSVETAYFGSAGLWGHSEVDDMQLQREMELVVDFYRGGVSRNEVARLYSESLVYFSKTKHDVYSSTHVEILGSGCLSVGGGHPMFNERPGISGLKNVQEFIEMIGLYLNLSPIDIEKESEISRAYMIENCSFHAFHNQFERIIRELI